MSAETTPAQAATVVTAIREFFDQQCPPFGELAGDAADVSAVERPRAGPRPEGLGTA
jgi:hypothetical protein